MIILIDAYNMLKQITMQRQIAERERARFVALMGRYAHTKKHHVIIVFDGGPYEWVHKERAHGVQVVYSGLHATADDYIKQYINDHRESDLLLVSDDRDLNKHAARFDMPSISPRDFNLLVQEALQGPVAHQRRVDQNTTKTTDESHADLDQLMEEASRTVPNKRDDEPHAAYIGFADGRKLSKDERRLLQKLKKL